ncbi:DUF47 domain-containing protein [Janibacter sp. G1551]|uniref:DUF47 domain-containing protein n=1 Tax=Janibacter sp. G1551 TaxID=3420440 RepID=UPI003D06F489
MGFRLTPQNTSFYDLFTELAQFGVERARELSELLVVTAEERTATADRLRQIEHRADEATHELMTKVNSAFITPFDREDIHALASDLDDCVDHIEAAADLITLYGVTEYPTGIKDQVEAISRMAEVTAQAMPRLRSMKDLDSYWIEVNRLENHADRTYRRLLADLFADENANAIRVMKLKEVIDELEAAADAFEQVANTVEGIAVKES